MTSFVLKMIAIVSMLIDHLGDTCFKHITIMNLIGRFAFPIFAFQISEGYIHTKNLKKYFLRLFLFALFSQIPFMLFSSTYTDGFTLNVFATLFVGLLSIFIYDKICNSKLKLLSNDKINTILKQIISIFIAILLAILAQVCHFDYGFFGIVIIFLFHIFKNNKLAMVISFVTSCIIKYGTTIILYSYNISYVIWYALLGIFTILPIIFICLYNGKQGKKVKYLLYLFYPVHLLILYFIFR